MIKYLLFIFLAGFSVSISPVLAQTEEHQSQSVQAYIVEIISEEEMDGGVFHYQFTATTSTGETYSVDTEESYIVGLGYQLNTKDRVRLQVVKVPEGTTAYFDDVHRQTGVWWIIAMFVAITLFVGRMRGVLSLVGLGVTVLILTFGLFPAILAGRDPVLATLIASVFILGVNMHLSHGFTRQTLLAYLGTLGGLSAVTIFTQLFIAVARLSGLASEEGSLLFWELDSLQIPVGILAAGIILGAVGVLDDVAVTQAEIVEELRNAHPNASRRKLFQQGMRIGRHHIASTVNTLVLVYAGAALPIFLLFMNQFGEYTDFLSNEIVVEELVRTMAGTCALILTVPLSTWLATWPRRTVDKPINQE